MKFKWRTFCNCIQWTKYNSKFYFKAAVSRPRKTWLVQIPPGTQWRLILFCAARDLSRSVIIVKTSFETEPTDETGRLSGGCVISLDKHNMKRHKQKMQLEVWSSSERDLISANRYDAIIWMKQTICRETDKRFWYIGMPTHTTIKTYSLRAVLHMTLIQLFNCFEFAHCI